MVQHLCFLEGIILVKLGAGRFECQKSTKAFQDWIIHAAWLLVLRMLAMTIMMHELIVEMFEQSIQLLPQLLPRSDEVLWKYDVASPILQMDAYAKTILVLASVILDYWSGPFLPHEIESVRTKTHAGLIMPKPYPTPGGATLVGAIVSYSVLLSSVNAGASSWSLLKFMRLACFGGPRWPQLDGALKRRRSKLYAEWLMHGLEAPVLGQTVLKGLLRD